MGGVQGARTKKTTSHRAMYAVVAPRGQIRLDVAGAVVAATRMIVEVWNDNAPLPDTLIGAARMKVDGAVSGDGALGRPLRATLALSRPGKGEQGSLELSLTASVYEPPQLWPELRVEVWDDDLGTRGDFLGQVVLKCSGKNIAS